MTAVLHRLLVALFALLAQPGFAQVSTPGTAAPGSAAAPAAAGKVELVEGDVRFFDVNLRMRRPSIGEVIYERESIVTGSDGEVHLRMEDGGYIGVRPDTKMRIANFRAEGDDQDRSVIGLLQGTFRSVTGWIAQIGPDRAIVRTPTAVIGIRGTEHEPLFIPEGSLLGEPGTYDRVHIGETVIRTAQGSVAVRPNQAGFAPHLGTGRPRTLDRIPPVFRPTRNEARFTGLHARIQQQLTERRAQRRQFIEQRRKQQQQRPQQPTPGTAQKAESRKAEQNREARKAEQNQKAAQQEARKAEEQKRAHEKAAKSRRE